MAILIRPVGNLNKKNSFLLQQKLKKVLAMKSEHCCVVDLATIKSINNFGLMTLVALHRIADKQGCNLYLMNLNDSVQYCLEVTGLDRILAIKQSSLNVNYNQVVN
ncbi:MAG: STAS domain-containing protein [Trichodesmium sp.]